MQHKRKQFLDATRQFWQSRTHTPLTHEDARQIAENISGFFRILSEWEAAERSAAPPKQHSTLPCREEGRPC